MNLDDYQQSASSTAIYPDRGDNPTYPALGLAGEAGEVCDHVKKIVRDDGGKVTTERRAKLLKEVGDVLWYIAALCDELGLSMGDVAAANLDKLADRQQRGALQGDGDER